MTLAILIVVAAASWIVAVAAHIKFDAYRRDDPEGRRLARLESLADASINWQRMMAAKIEGLEIAWLQAGCDHARLACTHDHVSLCADCGATVPTPMPAAAAPPFKEAPVLDAPPLSEVPA